MIEIKIEGMWIKFSIYKNVLKVELFGDNMHKYHKGKIELVVNVVELANLHDLIKKKLRLKS